jgi:four helix bundle protein
MFEDLHVWQSARELVNLVYAISRKPAFQHDFGLKDQIRRAALSVMSNIAEGFGSGSDPEFIKFLGYGRRSISETQSQLYTALDQQYLLQEECQRIYGKANETERQANRLIGYLSATKTRHSMREEPAPYEPDVQA